MKTFLRRDEFLFLLLWCSGYIGAKFGVPLAGTFTLLFWRYALIVAVLALYVTIKNDWHAPNRDTFVIGFLAHFIWLVAVFKSIEYGMNAGTAALIAAMQPILTTLCAPLFLNEKNNIRSWFGIALGFVGVCIFVGGDVTFSGIPLWVYALPSIATISLTAITIMERRGQMCETNMPIMTSLFWQAVVTLVLLAPLAWGVEGFHAEWNEEFVFAVAWLAFVATIAAYGMMFYLIRTRSATRVSSLQYFVPPVTMFIAYIVFREQLNLLGLTGLLVTSVGFYVLHKSTPQPV